MSELQAKFLVLTMALLFIGPWMYHEYKELSRQYDQTVKIVGCTMDCSTGGK